MNTLDIYTTKGILTIFLFLLFLNTKDESSPATDDECLTGCGLVDVISLEKGKESKSRSRFKDGAYYCYCAYVLRISRYWDFLSPMLSYKGIFLRDLKLSGESRS